MFICFMAAAMFIPSCLAQKRPTEHRALPASIKRIWPQEPDSFFGIKFGAPLNDSVPICPQTGQYVTTYDWVDFGKPCYEPVADFYQVDNISGFFDVFVELEDGKVGSIMASYHQDSQDKIMMALIAKFGPPTSTKVSVVTSRAGVSYQDDESEWSGENIVMTCESVGTKVDEGLIQVSTDSYRRYRQAKKQQQTDQLEKQF